MAKASYVNIAKAARKRSAATGTLVGVRLQDDEIKAIDSWARKQDPPVTRPYAIRRLVEIGLTVRTKSKQPTAARAERAKTLAWKTLESLAPGAADDDEKTSRRRRLIRGPEEFQGVRIDQPPAPSGKKPTRSG
jgi:hypothetical protein